MFLTFKDAVPVPMNGGLVSARVAGEPDDTGRRSVFARQRGEFRIDTPEG